LELLDVVDLNADAGTETVVVAPWINVGRRRSS